MNLVQTRALVALALLLGACSELKVNEAGPTDFSDARNAADQSQSNSDGSRDAGDASYPPHDARSDGHITDRDTSINGTAGEEAAAGDVADESNPDADPAGGDAETGAPNDAQPPDDSDAAPSDDATSDARRDDVTSEGDGRIDGDDGADALFDATDSSACIADCPELGQFRCADTGDAGLSKQVQICSLVRGCLQWFDTALCGPNEACCDGACRPVTCEQGTCPPAPAGSSGSCGATFDVFVDANAPLTGTCTKDSPCRTITAGIAAALANPADRRRILVAAGKYDAALGEQFPLTLRGGLAVVGSGNNTVIEGSGLVAHGASGGDVLDDFHATLMMGDFEAAVINSLSNVQVRPDPLVSANLLFGIVCDRGNAQEGEIPARPGATVSRVDLASRFNYAVLVTNSTIPTGSGCFLSMTGSSVHDARGGVRLTGCTTGAPTMPAVGAQIGGLSPGAGNYFRNIRSDLNGFSIRAHACTRRLLIESNTFESADAGILLAQLGASVAASRVTIIGNRFDTIDNFGLNVQGALLIDELRQNSFSNVSTSRMGLAWEGPAIVFDEDLRMKVKARSNLFVGNDVGVFIRTRSSDAPLSGDLDFGTTADPGNNTFRCNSGVEGGAIVGHDVFFDQQRTTGPSVAFEGNYWDQSPPTTVVDGGPPRNGLDIALGSHPPLNIQMSFPSDRVCPTGRVP